MKNTTGMVLGKFLPPHAGHLYLIEFAKRYVDDLTVVVGTLKRESIPGALRYQWLRELVPGARVVHLTDENPQAPKEHPDFWGIWERSLRAVLPHAIDYVFASEAYGVRLAEVLGARFIPVDPLRTALNVSGTAIRQDPFAHWSHLPPPVRAHFAKRVVIFGPESTGKTTLARRLAAHYRSVWVPEYARTWLEHREGAVALEDLEMVVRGQIASEEALARTADRVLILDTDTQATPIWSDALFGQVSPSVRDLTRDRQGHLYLLTDVDVPWVADPVRYLPNERKTFFDRCEAHLRTLGHTPVILRGSWEDRLRDATAAVDALLASQG